MGTAQRSAMLFPGGDYWQRVVRTAPGNLISYWPLGDASGTGVVNLASLRGMPAAAGIPAATSSNVTLAQPGIGDGKTSMLFNGTSSYVNIYSAELASAFSGAEGTLMVWVRVANAGVWADATSRYVVEVKVDANNYLQIWRSTTNNRLAWAYNAGNTLELITNDQAGLDWLCLALTWSKSGNLVVAYRNGVQVNTSTALGVWAGALSSEMTVIGAVNATPESVWSGSIAHVALWNTPLSAAQIAYLSRVR